MVENKLNIYNKDISSLTNEPDQSKNHLYGHSQEPTHNSNPLNLSYNNEGHCYKEDQSKEEQLKDRDLKIEELESQMKDVYNSSNDLNEMNRYLRTKQNAE